MDTDFERLGRGGKYAAPRYGKTGQQEQADEQSMARRAGKKVKKHDDFGGDR